MSSRFPRLALRTAVCALALALAPVASSGAADAAKPLRVCAHPDNLPFSAQDESGFDNRIAALIAQELGTRVEYTWLQPQHGLVRKTLKAGLCDALIGLPANYEGALTTAPYYRSRFVFLYRRGAHRFDSFDDPALRDARVGVQIVGDDMAMTPPAHALVARGVTHVIGFPVYGDTPAVDRMAAAIARGELDAGLAWGPAAGYFATRQSAPLDIAPARAPDGLAFLPFEFSMTVAVRGDDRALKDAIDAAIQHRRADIERILADYRVPLVAPEATAALKTP